MAKKSEILRKKEEFVTKLSWVVRGKQRRDVISNFKKPQTPTALAKRSGYSLNHTSRVLNAFKERGIATLLNPEAKTGRIYELTKVGRKIRDQISD